MDLAAGTAAVRGDGPRSTLVAAIVAAEIALVALGAATGHLLLAVAAAAAVAYFLVAFRAPTLSAMMIWIAAPLSVEGVLPGGAAVAIPTEPLIGVALLAWLTRAAYARRRLLPPSPIHRPLMVLGGIALLSVVTGSFPVAGIKAWVVSGAYALLGLAAFSWKDASTRGPERWVALAVASGAVLGLYGAIRSIEMGATARSAYGCARPFFPEHGTYAAYLCMTLPLALLGALETRGVRRGVASAATVTILLGIAFSFTRAAWLSLSVVLPVFLGVWAARHGRWKPLVVVSALVATVATVVVATGAGRPWVGHFASIADEGNVSNLERLNRWSAAIEMSRTHPWLGVGYGGYQDSYRVYRRKAIVTEQVYFRMGVHNELLRLLAETGVLGLAAGLWFLGALTRAAWTARAGPRDPTRGLLSIAVLAGLATYAVHALFNSYLGVDKVTVPFWYGVGALDALRRHGEGADVPPERSGGAR